MNTQKFKDPLAHRPLPPRASRRRLRNEHTKLSIFLVMRFHFLLSCCAVVNPYFDSIDSGGHFLCTSSGYSFKKHRTQCPSPVPPLGPRLARTRCHLKCTTPRRHFRTKSYVVLEKATSPYFEVTSRYPITRRYNARKQTA